MEIWRALLRGHWEGIWLKIKGIIGKKLFETAHFKEIELTKNNDNALERYPCILAKNGASEKVKTEKNASYLFECSLSAVFSLQKIDKKPLKMVPNALE